MNITSREQFQYALHAGHGSAALYVKQQGIEGVEDIILDACLHDRSYDPQCEESRAEWLIDLFADTKYFDKFAQKIISQFQKLTDPEDYDTQQLYELLCALTKRGHQAASLALQTWVKQQLAQQTFENNYAAGWIAIAGLEALPDIAECNGLRLLNDLDFWNAYTIEALLPKGYDLGEAYNLLKEKAQDNKAIQTYLAHDEEQTKQQLDYKNRTPRLSGEQKIRQEYSLKQLLVDAQAKEDIYYKTLFLGKYATLEERSVIQSHIEQLDNKDEKHLGNLLASFRWAELPALTPKIWQLVESNNTELRSKALTAISNSKHQQVGDFARCHIKNKAFLFDTLELLELFRLNFQLGDELVILEAIQDFDPTHDENTKHQAESIGRIFNKLAEIHSKPALIPLLLWVYTNSPCSVCRSDTVKHLQAVDALTPKMRQECLSDANSDIREIAKEL